MINCSYLSSSKRLLKSSATRIFLDKKWEYGVVLVAHPIRKSKDTCWILFLLLTNLLYFFTELQKNHTDSMLKHAPMGIVKNYEKMIDFGSILSCKSRNRTCLTPQISNCRQYPNAQLQFSELQLNLETLIVAHCDICLAADVTFIIYTCLSNYCLYYFYFNYYLC